MNLLGRWLLCAGVLAALLAALAGGARTARGAGLSAGEDPQIASLAPETVPAGSPDFMLTVNGVLFADGDVVRWNGAARRTTVQGSGRAVALIPAGDVASQGSAQVTVARPSAAFPRVSNALTFTIAPARPF